MDTMENSRWMRPLGSLLIILLIRRVQFGIAQGLIICTPRNSLLRPASIPIQIALGAVAFPHVQHAVVEPISIHYRCLLGGTVVLQTILSVSISCMIRLDDTDACALAQTPTTLQGKLRALTSLMNNQRCIGTPYEIKWIPPFDESRPGYIPSRAEALRSVAIQIVTGYLSRQVLVSFLWDILPLGLFWCLYIASWLNSLYMAGDLIALICGDPVEAHPPAFGSIRHTRTIRRFWGKYWHQANRFPFQGASNYICKELLGLRSLVQRYTNILCVFAVSGVFHVLTDRAERIPYEQSRAMRFFCAQAVGIMVEDGAQELWRRWHGYAGDGVQKAIPTWAKLVGYIWTWTFLSITAEWFFEPHTAMFLQKHGTPFGIVKKALSILGADLETGDWMRDWHHWKLGRA